MTTSMKSEEKILSPLINDFIETNNEYPDVTAVVQGGEIITMRQLSWSVGRIQRELINSN